MPERAQHVLFFAASAPCTGHAVLDAVLDAAVGERLLEAMLQVAKRSGLALQRHCIAASGRKEWPCVCGWDAMQQLASDGVHLFFGVFVARKVHYVTCTGLHSRCVNGCSRRNSTVHPSYSLLESD